MRGVSNELFVWRDLKPATGCLVLARRRFPLGRAVFVRWGAANVLAHGLGHVAYWLGASRAELERICNNAGQARARRGDRETAVGNVMVVRTLGAKRHGSPCQPAGKFVAEQHGGVGVRREGCR
jgi:hypothetical protein